MTFVLTLFHTLTPSERGTMQDQIKLTGLPVEIKVASGNQPEHRNQDVDLTCASERGLTQRDGQPSLD